MKTPSHYIRVWFGRRFITLVEIVGFTTSAILGVGVAYTLWKHEEVLAYGWAKPQPLSAYVTVQKEAVPIEWLVAPGDDVFAGTPILHIVTTPGASQRLRAQRQLAQAQASLEAAGTPDAAAALAYTNQAADALSSIVPEDTVLAPGKGGVMPLVSVEANDTIPAGTTVAVVYDLSALTCDLTLEVKKANKIEIGQLARLTLPGIEEPLEGKVVSADLTDEGGTASLRFENLSEEVRTLLYDNLFVNDVPFAMLRAEIVVGHQMLFVKLFGRGA